MMFSDSELLTVSFALRYRRSYLERFVATGKGLPTDKLELYKLKRLQQRMVEEGLI